MIRNNDGRYWIFTTGDGVFAMSSPNADFTGWRAEAPVFPVGTWPGWINNYVTGFGGTFWAPDVIKVGSQYRLYYSCAGQGAPAAIGLATANNLAGPWTDQGLVVAGNNAIDPAPLVDGSNQWLTWGNWQTGIDLLQLNTSTGKPLNSSRWDLVPGQVEAPYLHKDGSFYYLFFQRGLCCQGVNSGYTTMVGAIDQRHRAVPRQEWRQRAHRRQQCRQRLPAEPRRPVHRPGPRRLRRRPADVSLLRRQRQRRAQAARHDDGVQQRLAGGGRA